MLVIIRQPARYLPVPCCSRRKIGIANPDERKIFQVVQTHAIPERIQFATETATIKSGENYQIQSKSDWSSAAHRNGCLELASNV